MILLVGDVKKNAKPKLQILKGLKCMVVLHYRKEGAILKKNLGISGLSWYNMERCQGSKQGQARKEERGNFRHCTLIQSTKLLFGNTYKGPLIKDW